MLHDIADARHARDAAAGADRFELPLDEIAEVGDFAPATLRYLTRRIEASRGLAQAVNREVELDGVWRLLDCALAERRRAGHDDADLAATQQAVAAAHDLLDRDIGLAAATLRTVAM